MSIQHLDSNYHTVCLDSGASFIDSIQTEVTDLPQGLLLIPPVAVVMKWEQFVALENMGNSREKVLFPELQSGVQMLFYPCSRGYKWVAKVPWDKEKQISIRGI